MTLKVPIVFGVRITKTKLPLVDTTLSACCPPLSWCPFTTFHVAKEIVFKLLLQLINKSTPSQTQISVSGNSCKHPPQGVPQFSTQHSKFLDFSNMDYWTPILIQGTFFQTELGSRKVCNKVEQQVLMQTSNKPLFHRYSKLKTPPISHQMTKKTYRI